jgi:hypothetical protein
MSVLRGTHGDYARLAPRRQSAQPSSRRDAPDEQLRQIHEVWEHRDRDVIFAKVICVTLSFAGYDLFVATDSRLGKGTLWRAMWAKR